MNLPVPTLPLLPREALHTSEFKLSSFLCPACEEELEWGWMD
jgi:hypothetical protein